MSNALVEPERRILPQESAALASGRGQAQVQAAQVQDQSDRSQPRQTSATGRLALLLADALDGMDQGAADCLGPLPPGGPEAVREAVRTSGFGRLPESGADPYEVLKSLSRLLAWGAADPAHPHCVAHLHTPPLAISVAAETVTAALNQSLDSWDQSPVAGEIEQAVIETLVAAVGYQHQTGKVGSTGVLTSGGTESNLMALLLARDEALRHRFDADPDLDGIPAVAAGRLRILTSELAHFSVARNAALLGIGERSVVPIETDDRGRMRLDKAAEAFSRIDDHGEIPIALVATAGTTDHGAIDPLKELAALAARRATWFHVDAAYGGGLVLGRRAQQGEHGQHREHAEYGGQAERGDHGGHGRQAEHRDNPDHTEHHLRALPAADSITLDLHKLGWQPIPAGVFLVRRAAALRTLEKRVAYLNPLDDEQAGFPSLLGRSLRTTRRADAVKIAAAFATLGREGFAELIDRCRHLARYAAAAIKANAELELTAEPALTTVLFRFLPEREEHTDHVNAALRRHLLTTGKAVVGRTELPRPRPGTAPGRVRLKLTLLNPHTAERQIDELLELVCRAGRQAGGSAGVPAGERRL